ncbi:chemotaxis protein CheD [Sphingomonas sp. KRR8]|uniref:chemotaxis protein CheD n=1 Tax=Sphingomonas sp. KRR8 TaxID=2942996 RepID=UPI002020BDFA|nr:chemotaxis protein CheD [Sphingomonas sp. KRR8]URD61919.1 chemotaxis protein CheD [Sphingomonas sp. KRR8]
MRRQTIVQGEHAVIAEPDVVVTTILGSCVAVCLHDPQRRIGGMNHFLLPQPAGGSLQGVLDPQRYGIHAMEVLINALMARGAERSRLKAHCYGGAQVVAGLGDIGAENCAFARHFLATEHITVVHEDLGGRNARRVEFMPFLGRSRCLTVREPAPPANTRLPLRLPERAGELELF